jgi:hypothetical protein
VHNVHAGYYGATEQTGHPQDEWGFAISGGIQLKNLPTGPGDKLSLDATYADGATKYLISGVTGNNFDHFSGGNNGFYNSFAASLFDGVFTNGSRSRRPMVGASAALTFTTGPRTGIQRVRQLHPDQLRHQGFSHCARSLPAVGVFAACKLQSELSIWQVGTRTAWTPVKNLTFSGEDAPTSTRLAQVRSRCSRRLASSRVAYNYADQGIWSGNLRVRRTW